MSEFFDEKDELVGEFTKEQLEEKKPEKKQPGNRKDTIKNVAIVFLSIMLVLTFFSNTIMNFSLPQVATQMIESGSVSPQIRGTGTVTAEDPYSICIKETRKISGVAVKEGAHVDIGDVIYYLEDRESSELADARKALQEYELSYEQALFSGDIPDNVITNVRNGRKTTYDTYQAELKAADDKYDAAKIADEAAQAEIDYLTQTAAYDSAGNSYNAATPAYTTAQAEYELAVATQNGDTAKIEELEKFIASNNKDASQLTNYGTQQSYSYAQKLATATNNKNKTALNLAIAEREKTELLKSISTEISLCQARDKITEQKEKIAKLEAESVGASVQTPVAGIVSSLDKTAGESTSADETIAVIQVDGKDMTTSFSVTNAQAQKLRVGDAAQPQNSWQFGSDFKATLTGIKNDKSDPGNKKLLTFKIESQDVTPGQNISLAIGERSVDYNMIVPNSAIKSDVNGKFVLIIVSKSSPLGNRYIATRADVKVIAQDDRNTAIEGALDGYEYVITTANQEIKSGSQVRLANE
jgi:hypothetical protein